MRAVLLAVLLAGCAVGESEPEPADGGSAGPVEVEAVECPADPCDLWPDAKLEAFACMRSRIDECAECRTFRCPGVAISVCQRPCLPPEP